MVGFSIHWSSILVFFALGLIGIWVAYSFLNKSGLYLFSILITTISFWLESANVFSYPIAMIIVLAPLLFFALLTCLNKFGIDEAKKLFYTILISMASVFIFVFFEAAYLDSFIKSSVYLSWDFLSKYVVSTIAFAVSSLVTMNIVKKIPTKKLKKFLVLSIYIAIASAIFAIIYTILVYSGLLSFGGIILTIIISLVSCALISLCLGYIEKYMNREVANKQKEEESKVEEKEQKNPEDID